MYLDDDTLLAYADGAVDPAQQAEVAALLAQHPDLQTRVDELRRLQRSLRATFDAADLLPTPQPHSWARRSIRRGWRLALVLAAGVLTIFTLALLAAPLESGRSSTLSAPTSALIESHSTASARPTPSPIPTVATTATLIPLGALPAGPIVFALNDPGPQSCSSVRIQILRTGDTQPTNLANGCMPILSPDQQQIAYLKDTAVFVMQANGDKQRRIAGPGLTDQLSAPAWSPDSQHIAFVGSQNDETSIYIVSVDGTGLRRLAQPTADLPANSNLTTPIWSPDGQRIAVGAQIQSTANDQSTGIFVLSSDGAPLQRLTSGRELQVPSAWSPDGTSLLYESVQANGASSLAIIPASGGQPLRIGNGIDTAEGAWSPDSKRIAFVSRRDGSCDIYLLDLTNGQLIRLTSLPTQEYGPAWSADGEYIFFGAYALDSPRGSIYALRADGSQLVRLITSESGLMWYAH